MRLVGATLLLSGCLLGVDGRRHAGEVGATCEEDFQCQRGLTCGHGSCTEWCLVDDDCPDDKVCDVTIDSFDDITSHGCTEGGDA